MEREWDSPCQSRTYPGQGPRSPGRRNGWQLEFRDCGAISGQALLWTAERWIEGMWGRRLWWEMPVEESQAAMEARRYCWVMRGGGAVTVASLPLRVSISSWTRERLARQMPDALNYRVGPQPGGPPPLCAWLAQQQRRTPGKRALLSAWTGRATEKDWPKRPSDRQLQEARKKTERAVTPAVEAVHVPAHFAPPGSLPARQLHHLHTQLTLGQCHRQNKSFVSMGAGLLQLCPILCDPVDCAMPSFSVREGGSPGNIGAYWSILVAIPF